MGFFSRNADKSRFESLEERLAKLERAQRDLETEWTSWYDKARRVLMRITKRAELVEKADAEDSKQTFEPAAAPIPLHPRTGLLSERQKEVQQQIMRRRAGG